MMLKSCTSRYLQRQLSRCHARAISSSASSRNESTAHAPKKAGDISSVFPSLSDGTVAPLPERFAALKASIVAGNEEKLTAGFYRLLDALAAEVAEIAAKGSRVIPEIDFADIHNPDKLAAFRPQLLKRGIAVVRGVVTPEQAMAWKHDVQAYIAANPHTRAFPPDDPQVFELYWSPSQVAARAHPHMLATQQFLMSFWNTAPERDSARPAPISIRHPLTYADRLRIRQPGDARFALGPHVDGGSVERWEPRGYGAGHVFDDVLAGAWEAFDPWAAAPRLAAVSDLYNGAGACSMFRMYQGWLSLSTTAAREGTLLVNPLQQLATAYFLLRPFFAPRNPDPAAAAYLAPENWVLAAPAQQTSELHGAVPGASQELAPAWHPHLELARTMVHVPRVRPGDYVAWHCDTIHAVDREHAGAADASVMYIPACPMTAANLRYLARQRDTFARGVPAPDFPGGDGEAAHVGRATPDDVAGAGGEAAVRSMGLELWDESDAQTAGEKLVLQQAKTILA